MSIQSKVLNPCSEIHVWCTCKGYAVGTFIAALHHSLRLYTFTQMVTVTS